jgi:hypothetical protein
MLSVDSPAEIDLAHRAAVEAGAAVARDDRRPALRAGALAAACTLIGTLASGPIALFVLHTTHPQPDWQDARVFARHYHPIQSLPFFLGLLLVSGFVLLIASLHVLAEMRMRARTQAALVFTSAFAALVLLNYAVQTTFVPRLTVPYLDANGPLLAALTMSNPRSLGWSLEMWGYGWLGVATWLVAPVFSGNRLERVTACTFVANGPISIAGALWTALDADWLLSTTGLLMFAAWNALVVIMSALAFQVFRARRAKDDST